MITTVTVSDETLEQTPERMFKLIRAIGRSSRIRAAMQARGYSEDDHRQGWRLLHAVSGQDAGGEIQPVEAQDVRAAMASLNAADEELFVLVNAVLQHTHPAVLQEITAGLAATRDEAQAVTVVDTILVRLDAIAERSSEDAQGALDRLARRGLTPEHRQALRNMVTLAQSAPLAVLPDAAAQARQREAYLDKLRELRVWFDEWSGVARVAIGRRDDLIRLGLAKRRSRGTKGEGNDDLQGVG